MATDADMAAAVRDAAEELTRQVSIAEQAGLEVVLAVAGGRTGMSGHQHIEVRVRRPL